MVNTVVSHLFCTSNAYCYIFYRCSKEDYDLCENCFPAHGKEAEYKKIEQTLFSRRSGHPFCQIGRNLVSHHVFIPDLSEVTCFRFEAVEEGSFALHSQLGKLVFRILES